MFFNNYISFIGIVNYYHNYKYASNTPAMVLELYRSIYRVQGI